MPVKKTPSARVNRSAEVTNPHNPKEADAAASTSKPTASEILPKGKKRAAQNPPDAGVLPPPDKRAKMESPHPEPGDSSANQQILMDKNVYIGKMYDHSIVSVGTGQSEKVIDPNKFQYVPDINNWTCNQQRVYYRNAHSFVRSSVASKTPLPYAVVHALSDELQSFQNLKAINDAKNKEIRSLKKRLDTMSDIAKEVLPGLNDAHTKAMALADLAKNHG